MLRRLARAGRPVIDILRRAAPRSAALVFALQIFGGVAIAWALLLTNRVIEDLLAQTPTVQRLWAALPALALLASTQAARLLIDTTIARARARMAPRVRRAAEEALYAASLRIDLGSFDDAGFYDQLHRARDRGVVNLESATESVIEASSATLAVLGAAFALYWLQPVLLLALSSALIPEGWAAFRTAGLRYAGIGRTVELMRRADMMAELATARESAAEIRAHQAQDYVLGRYREAADALLAHLTETGLAEASVRGWGRVFAGAALAATVALLGWMLVSHWLPLAAAGTAIIAIRGAGEALTRLMQLVHEMLQKGLYIADYQDFLDSAAGRVRAASGRTAPASPQKIILTDVGFCYPGSDMVLSGISITIRAGQTIALAGENGSGKTTLAKLIAGLYQPTLGKIAWDEVDLAQVAPASLADRVVMVLQDPVRWPSSARENIRVGRHQRADPDDAALNTAARHSRADEVVDRLPAGWRTLLSTHFRGGCDLSGGQWQRFAVARGLFRDAPLVIWDEPTAALDAKAEHAVYESLRELAHHRTVILITHRLASIRNADCIYFLERGRIVEQGRHDELVLAGGRYAELYQLQSRLHAHDGSEA